MNFAKFKKNIVLSLRLSVSSWYAKYKLSQALRNSENIIIGPWISEVGFEILYWIPFLQKIKDSYGLDKKKLIIISRGGPAAWYANVASNYFDIFDFCSLEQFREFDFSRGIRRHMKMYDFEKGIIAAAAKKNNIEKFGVIHPSVMYRMFMPFWKQKQSIRLIKEKASFKNLPEIHFDPASLGLPKDYAAVKFYFTECFPETEENKNFARKIIQDLSRKIPVVLLDTGLKIDDHSDVSFSGSKNIYIIKDKMSVRDNLEVQTKVVSKARVFVGTQGGFSYIPPMYGVSSIAFYSKSNFSRNHLDVASRVFSGETFGAFIPVHIKDWETVKLLLKSEL